MHRQILGHGSSAREKLSQASPPILCIFLVSTCAADGKLLVMTPIDPAFLLIPLLQAVQPVRMFFSRVSAIERRRATSQTAASETSDPMTTFSKTLSGQLQHPRQKPQHPKTPTPRYTYPRTTSPTSAHSTQRARPCVVCAMSRVRAPRSMPCQTSHSQVRRCFRNH